MFALRYLVAIACLLKGVTASGDPLDALATKSSCRHIHAIDRQSRT